MISIIEIDRFALFGIGAGVLDLLTCGVYLRSIVKGDTKPDRVTWWVLAVVSGMIAVSYYASGARETVWLPAAYALSFLVTAIFSLKYGDGPLILNLVDRVSLMAAVVSGLVWWSMRSPIPALFMNIVTEFAGLVPTIYKAYKRPWTESRYAWVLATIASIMNVCAINEWSFVIASYPLYILLTNFLIMMFVLQKRHDSKIS